MISEAQFFLTTKQWSFAQQNCHGFLPFYEKKCHIQVYVLKKWRKREKSWQFAFVQYEKAAITMKFTEKRKSCHEVIW